MFRNYTDQSMKVSKANSTLYQKTDHLYLSLLSLQKHWDPRGLSHTMYSVLSDTRRFAQGPCYMCAHLFLHPLKTHSVIDPAVPPFNSSRSSVAYSHHPSLTCDWSQVTNMDLPSASPLWTSPDPHPGWMPGCAFCWAFCLGSLAVSLVFSHPPLLLPP